MSSFKEMSWPQLHAKGSFKKESEVQAWLTQINALSPWLDHLTQDVFPDDSDVENFAWAFKQNLLISF